MCVAWYRADLDILVCRLDAGRKLVQLQLHVEHELLDSVTTWLDSTRPQRSYVWATIVSGDRRGFWFKLSEPIAECIVRVLKSKTI